MSFVIRPSKNLLPIADVTLSVVNFGLQEKDANHKYGPILRSEYILQYITDGEGYLELCGKVFKLKKGDMFCLPKNELLTYWAKPNNPYTYYWLGLDGVNIKKLLEIIGFSSSLPVIGYSDDGIVEKFEKIKTELLKNNFVGHIQSVAYSYELLSYLLEKNQQNLMPIENEATHYVNQAIEIIHNSYNDDLSITRIAKSIGLCRNYFSVIFKRVTGVSPVEYLLSYRISMAKIMLRENASVTETAMNCGFNSINNFSTQFKRVEGVSPYEFKKKR